MSKEKVFISGPMTGIEDFNKPAFMEAERILTEAGYSVFNPAWLNFDDAWDRTSIMLIGIAALASCQYIYQLPGWEKSVGAKLEYANSLKINVPVLREVDLYEKAE